MLTAPRLVALAAVAAAAFLVWKVALPAEQEAARATGDAAVGLLDTRTDARFTVAQANLELRRRTTGTYAGAAMPAGATLVRADAGSYCVQVGPPGTVAHLAGPGGAAAAGAC
jgi:hypothetical protein